MNREEIVMVCAPDLSGQVRGKGFPLSDSEPRMKRGIGWVPTNLLITTFNTIAETPFGSLGDLLMIPDPEAEVRIDFGDGSPNEHFFLGYIRNTDGSPWDLCLRGRLAEALEALHSETGLRLKSSFELEFQFREDQPSHIPGYVLSGFRSRQSFGEVLFAALRQAGVEPDSYMREWADHQYEVTVHPQLGVKAADHGVIVKELARATAQRLDSPITFTPIRDVTGAGNGAHIHMSFVDDNGQPATYDPNGVGGLSRVAGQFAAGILHHLPDFLALTAPSLISYSRLTPHRWSAPFNNLGFRDREAALRICPVAELPDMDVAKQFNIEFRAADSAASPHLQLAALVFAGLDGIREDMAPPAPTEEDLSLLGPDELKNRGFVRLPESLPDALSRLENSKAVKSWFGELFVDVYLRHKHGEMAYLEGKTIDEVCRLYEQVY